MDPESWLQRRSQTGDLLLTGSDGLVGRLIQVSTKSLYSHAAVVVDGQIVEAYEYGLTPNESDEGIYVTPFSRIRERNDELRTLLLRRPVGLDVSAFRASTNHYIIANPSFASIGICLLGIARVANLTTDSPEVARGMSSDLLLRLLEFQAVLTGDGDKRVQCAELATRIYTKAGISLSFESPLLAPLLAVLASGTGDLRSDEIRLRGDVWVHLADSAVVRNSETARWAGWRDVKDVVSSLRNRFTESAPPDMADFIVPNDFVRAKPFETVGVLHLREGVWQEVGVEGV